MPVTIDEVTADVVPPVATPPSSDAAPAPAAAASDARRQRELLERLHHRALRVKAD